jgi:hypothetical protein
MVRPRRSAAEVLRSWRERRATRARARIERRLAQYDGSPHRRAAAREAESRRDSNFWGGGGGG